MIINLRQRWASLPWLIGISILVGACNSTERPEELTVVASTSILGDVTQRLVGDEVEVEVLIPSSADPHGFQASARQAASLRDADIVVANGLGLEAGLADVLDAAQSDGVFVLEVGPEIGPLSLASSSTIDPHFWLDPQRMSVAAELITGALVQLAGAEQDSLEASLTAFQDDLRALDQEVEDLLATITNRKLVASHDSLGYLANRYGFEMLGTVAPGGSTLASPSPRDISELIDSMQAADITAIFTDAAEPNTLADLIASETDGTVAVVPLHIGALGPPDSQAGTYTEMIRFNARQISAALS